MYSASQNGRVMDIEDVDITKTVAVQGRGLGGPGTLIFGPKWGPKDWKNILGDWALPLSKGLDDPPPPPFAN